MAYRILIVDSHKTVRLAAQMVFAKDHKVLIATAQNSFDALDKMHLLKPTFALMDQVLAKQLTDNLLRSPCPIRILEKPFNSKSLFNQVHLCLNEILAKESSAKSQLPNPQKLYSPQLII